MAERVSAVAAYHTVSYNISYLPKIHINTCFVDHIPLKPYHLITIFIGTKKVQKCQG